MHKHTQPHTEAFRVVYLWLVSLVTSFVIFTHTRAMHGMDATNWKVTHTHTSTSSLMNSNSNVTEIWNSKSFDKIIIFQVFAKHLSLLSHTRAPSFTLERPLALCVRHTWGAGHTENNLTNCIFFCVFVSRSPSSQSFGSVVTFTQITKI